MVNSLVSIADDDVTEAFGRTLRAHRTHMRLTQEQLADRAGMDPSYPSLLELGKRMPTLSAILKLAEALQITPEQLIQDLRATLGVRRP